MFIRHITPALLWALLILVLCGMPGSQLPRFDLLDLLNADKVIHAGLFLMQVMLLVIAFSKQHTFISLRYKAIPVALVAGIAYGVLTEFLQLFIFRERTFDYLDMTANIVGSFAGAGFYLLVYR